MLKIKLFLVPTGKNWLYRLQFFPEKIESSFKTKQKSQMQHLIES